MANHIITSRPNGAPQFYTSNVAAVAPAVAAPNTPVGDSFSIPAGALGNNAVVSIDYAVSMTNNANNKIVTLQASNNPEFATSATVFTEVLASVAGALHRAVIFTQQTGNVVKNINRVGTPVTTAGVSHRLPIYFRVVVQKAVASDSVVLEMVSVNVRPGNTAYTFRD